MTRRQKADRDARIRRASLLGHTARELARAHGLSIRQIRRIRNDDRSGPVAEGDELLRLIRAVAPEDDEKPAALMTRDPSVPAGQVLAAARQENQLVQARLRLLRYAGVLPRAATPDGARDL